MFRGVEVEDVATKIILKISFRHRTDVLAMCPLTTKICHRKSLHERTYLKTVTVSGNLQISGKIDIG
jgi:hypothetical protein